MKINIVPKCGECLFYNKRHPAKKLPCSQLDKNSYNVAPPCFIPNVQKVSNSIGSFGLLSSLFSNLTYKQKKILLLMLLSEAKVNKGDFTFGTKVYTKVYDGSYLSDYISGFVLGYSDGKVVISGPPMRKSLGKSYVGIVYPESLIKYQEFLKIRKRLVHEGKINRYPKEKVATSQDDYEPPLIEEQPQEKKPRKREDTYEHITKTLTLRG